MFASHWPSGEQARATTGASWPTKSRQSAFGKGLRSFGSGSLGTKLSGSMFSRRFIARGQR